MTGIAITGSLQLQEIARVQGGVLKTAVNRLSGFLSRKKLDLEEEHRRYVEAAIRRVGIKRFVRYGGKLVMIIDGTGYPKNRSRGKKRPMPRKGQVLLHNVPSREKLFAPGYQELHLGLLLKNGRCLGITRKLFTEKMEFFPSQNALEEAEIRRALRLVREVLKRNVILVADRGFKRKELLHWLQKMERVDFVIRIDGKLNVDMRGWKGLLEDTIIHEPERTRMFWRDTEKKAVLSEVRSSRVEMEARSGKVELYVVCLTPINRENLDPMFLATTLAIRDREALSWVIRTYSKRWAIETFFHDLKESLGAGDFRVFSCWEAIDRLLAMAHMALLAIALLYWMIHTAPKQVERMKAQLRTLFARPPELTLGRLIDLLAMETVPA